MIRVALMNAACHTGNLSQNCASGSRLRFFVLWTFRFLGVLTHGKIVQRCTVPSVCNTVGLLIFLKLCPVFTFLQQLMTKGL